MTAFTDFDFSIMPSTSDVEVPDFHDRIAALRRETPVAPVPFHGGVGYLLTRYHDVFEGFRLEREFNLREFHKAATFPTMGETIMGMEGDTHRRHRDLVSLPFRASTIAQFRASVLREMCAGYLDEIVGAGTGEAELMDQFVRRLPVAAICRLLGIPGAPAARGMGDRVHHVPVGPRGIGREGQRLHRVPP